MKVSIPLSVWYAVPEGRMTDVLQRRLRGKTFPVPATLDVQVPPDLGAALRAASVVGVITLRVHGTVEGDFPLFSLRVSCADTVGEPVAIFDLWTRSRDQLKAAMDPVLNATGLVPFSVDSYVHPDWRGAGFGTELYAALARLVAPVGGMIVPAVWTGSTTSAHAQAVWAKLAVRGDLRCWTTPSGFVYGCQATPG